MGNFTAVGDIGRVGISAVLTFIVVYIGWRTTAYLYALAAMLLGLVCYFFLLHHKSDIVSPKSSPQGIDVPLWQLITQKRFIFSVSASFFDSFAGSSLYIFLPFLLLKRGIDPAFLGLFAATFFVGSFLGKIVLGKFVDKIGNSQVFIMSEITMAICIFFLANSTSIYLISALSIVLGIFTKGTVPVLQTMLAESVTHHENLEKAFGFNALIASIAATLAPLLLGIIADKMGIVAAFNIMALMVGLAIIPAIGFYLTRPKTNFIANHVQ